jgi:hypothetical protein
MDIYVAEYLAEDGVFIIIATARDLATAHRIIEEAREEVEFDGDEEVDFVILHDLTPTIPHPN